MKSCQSCVLVFLFLKYTKISNYSKQAVQQHCRINVCPFWFILSVHTNEVIYNICFVCNTTDH